MLFSAREKIANLSRMFWAVRFCSWWNICVALFMKKLMMQL